MYLFFLFPYFSVYMIVPPTRLGTEVVFALAVLYNRGGGYSRLGSLLLCLHLTHYTSIFSQMSCGSVGAYVAENTTFSSIRR